MTPAERGRIIKEARIAKKMTQSEVVGSFITRNMLSQIESGNATPSVKTLEYLAQTLDIPVSELMPSGEESVSESSADVFRLVRAKELFYEGDFSGAIDVIGDESGWGMLSDEFCAVLARCYLGLAEKMSEDDTAGAVEYAKKAAELADRGMYANPSVKTESLKLMGSLAERLSKYYAGLISKT